MKSQASNNQNYVGYIYVRTLKCTGQKYVGQTVNLKKRNSQWKNLKYSYAGRKIDEARKRHGVDDNDWLQDLFMFTALTEEDLASKLDFEETAYIKKYNSVEEGLNISYGRGMLGLHHTDEAKAKISKALTGITRSTETRMKMSAAKKRWWEIKKQNAA